MQSYFIDLDMVYNLEGTSKQVQARILDLYCYNMTEMKSFNDANARLAHILVLCWGLAEDIDIGECLDTLICNIDEEIRKLLLEMLFDKWKLIMMKQSFEKNLKFSLSKFVGYFGKIARKEKGKPEFELT
jgi:hypothetical protein